MQQNKIIFVIAFLILQIGCGSGGGNDGPKPLGLFSDTSNAQASASVSIDALNAGDMTIVSDQVFGSNLIGAEVSSSAGKSFSSRTGENCTNVDSMNVSCSDTQHGTVRGDFKVTSSIHYDENSLARRRGKSTIRSEYSDFTYSQTLCQRDVQIKGVLQCDIDFDFKAEQDGISVDISGLCNTAATPDHVMQIWLGGKEHHVGYDLALNLRSKITASQQFFLKDLTIDGTISYDGTVYPYDAVKSVIQIKCQ